MSEEGDAKRYQTEVALWKAAVAECVALHAEVKRLAALKDDALAIAVATDCHDKGHDTRWCSTCEARADGIEACRAAIEKRVHGEPPCQE